MHPENSAVAGSPQLPIRCSSLLAFAATVSLFAACGGGGGGGPVAPVDNLEQGLNKLGVNTGKTPRQSAPGLTMEERTTPLGRRAVLTRTDELALVNIALDSDPVATGPLVVLDLTDSSGNATQDLLFGQDQGQAPFLAGSSSFSSPGTMRAAVAADCDGNGLQEMVFVYQDGIETRVRRVSDQTQGFTSSDVQIASIGNVENVTAIAADLDLDGRDDLVLGLTVAGVGKVMAFRAEGGTFTMIGNEIDVQPDLPGANLWLQLAAGNIDNDAAPEIAVASQEVLVNAGTARTIVLDDAQANFAELRNELFTARDQNNNLRVALTASVAMGDVDGDGLDEVLFAGLTELSTGCNSTKQFFVAYDDKENAFAELGTSYRTYFYPGCNSPANRRVRTIHLNALDYDGDGRAEIAANQFFYDDFVDSAPWTMNSSWHLPDATVWNQNAFGWFDRTSTSFVVGNFDGDDREDLAVYRQDTNDVLVYGLPATAMTTQQLRLS